MTERKRKRGFSARFVETVKPGTRTKLYCDDNGLYLAVQPSGSRQWVQRLVIRGRRRELGLGGFPLVSLAEAREAAFHNRKLARQGGDPLAHKRKSEVPTFEEAARTVIAIHRSGWRNAKHAAQWDSTLREYAFPRLGTRPVSDIDTKDVMAALLPIWTEKPETAKRVRQRIGTIMKWAIAQGHRTDNPAGEALGAALPKTDNGKRHHAALPHAKVADAIEVVQGSGAGMAVKLAFEFLVLTAARSGEIRLATWDEIDTDARTWTIPAERMKANQEHRVPLCARAMQILAEARALEEASGLVFPGRRASKPLADLTLSKLMRDLNIDAVPHGFRSSFRDWAAERANAPPAVAEAALAHTVRNKVEAAYNRTDLFERRRKLMDQWSDYLSGEAGIVVPMAAVRHGG